MRRFAGSFQVRRVNSRKAKETPCWAACGRRRSAGVRRGKITSKGVPGETQRSGFAGERRKHGARELSTSVGSDGCAVASDEGQHRVCLVTGTAAACLPLVCGALPHTPRRRKVRTVRNTLQIRYSELRSLAPPLQTKPADAGLSFGFRTRLFWRKRHEKRY